LLVSYYIIEKTLIYLLIKEKGGISLPNPRIYENY